MKNWVDCQKLHRYNAVGTVKVPSWQIGASVMDGGPGSPLDPPASSANFAHLRESAPVLFEEGMVLASRFRDKLGVDTSAFDLIKAIVDALPEDRKNLIPAKRVADPGSVASSLRHIKHDGKLRARFGNSIVLHWPGQLIHELGDGLGWRATHAQDPDWRAAATAAYDLFLRICATVYEEFEIAS